jgi:hypothetical protein
MATEPRSVLTAGTASRAGRRERGRSGADRLTVCLFSLAAFFVVLTLLAGRVPSVTAGSAHQVTLLRKIYRTTVIETIAGGSGPAGTSVSQSVSSSGSATPVSAPATRTS